MQRLFAAPAALGLAGPTRRGRTLLMLVSLSLAPAAWAQAPVIASFLPPSKTLGISTGSTFFTLTLSAPVQAGVVLVTLSVTGSGNVSTPSEIAIPEGQTSAQVEVTSAMVAGSSSITASLNGNEASVTVTVLPVDLSARADFDGDGRSDVLWRNSTTGENYVYPMSGTTILGTEGYARTVADQNWQIAGVGDFDGDGRADVLWRNAATGENYVYLMNGKDIAGEGYIRTVTDLDWKVAGVGDLDGDGKADIVWRNLATGENYLYPMEGLAIKATEGYLRTVADLNWKIAGVGDLDGDLKDDIVWRNAATGENYLYPMDGTTILGGEGYLRTVADLNWRIAGTGDFDGDGNADILWRNFATGENYLYPMDGTAILGGEGYLRTVADLAWRVAAVGDYDGDGKADVLWRHGTSGENYLYPMDGTQILAGEGYVRTVADGNWRVLSGGTPPPQAGANLVFFTSTSYAANFGSAEAADALCQARAAAAGLPQPSQYVAWVSSSTSSAQARLGSARAWVRIDGKPFADTVADLAASKTLYLPHDEFGTAPSASLPVFTGINYDGTLSSATCTNWTVTSGSATTGRTGAGGFSWTIGGTHLCNTPARLYCLGASRTAPLSFTPAAGRRAFVTSVWTPPSQGLANADSRCQAEAFIGGLPGTYKALLATPGASAASRFSAAGATWVRTDGVRLFATASGLAAGAAMEAPLNVTYAGVPVTPMASNGVWVGAPDFATPGSDATTCTNWSTTAGAAGTARANHTVEGLGFALPCDNPARLFCLQQ
jgi:hypothetical protein